MISKCLEVSYYHHKETVRTNSSIKIRVIASGWQDIFEKEHHFLRNGYFCDPFFHQDSWLKALTRYTFNIKSDVNFDGRSYSFLLLVIQVVQQGRVIHSEQILLPLRLHKRDKCIDLQLYQRDLSPQVSWTTHHPAHSIDLNCNLRQYLIGYFPALAVHTT